MNKVTCGRVAAMVQRLSDLCADDQARRAWLWLRAREKDNDESIAALERAEPGIVARMAAYDARALAIEDPRARRQAYAAMLDELGPNLDRDGCDCPMCRRPETLG